MDNKSNEKVNPKYPTKKRLKSECPNGKLDELGFYRSPSGSFWDPDNEYFNREGFDTHGGFYTENMEYIEGPSFIPELGCYEDEKENYMNINWEEELYDDLPEEGEISDDEEKEEKEENESEKKKKGMR